MTTPITQLSFEESVRRSNEPDQVSLYMTVAETGFVLTQDVDNKVAVTVIPAGLPQGFDLFVTAEGPAIRFIGTGLGNGDTRRFQMLAHLSIATTSGSATATIRCKTRPYTEASFANAVDCPGAYVTRKLTVNDNGAFAIVAPIAEFSDGDLIELSINPDAGVTISHTALALTVIEA